jgi:hypothetical protein
MRLVVGLCFCLLNKLFFESDHQFVKDGIQGQWIFPEHALDAFAIDGNFAQMRCT